MRDVVYKCDRCGRGFTLEEAGTIYEDGRRYTACPSCGSEDLEEAEVCEHCGEIVYPWKRWGGICTECRAEAFKAFRKAWDSLDDWIKEYLEDGYIDININ